MKSVLSSLPLFILLFTSISSNAHSDEWTPARADGHAPIGVMGDHYHNKGEWMVSYRLMNMVMEGNLTGNSSIDNSTIFQNYMVAPQKMNMNMHMFGAMYAPSDKITLMGMVNLMDKTMQMTTKMGVDFETNSSGIGDAKISGIWNFMKMNGQSVHLNTGIKLPTGSIDKKADTPMGTDQQLPYGMQPGSGTWDFNLGTTYLGQSETFSWGIQPMSLIRTGENKRGYRLGNELKLTSWGAYSFAKWISTSLRVEGKTTGKISGIDEALNPMMSPASNTANSGGKLLNGGLGINIYLYKGPLSGLRIAAEYILPFYQEPNGIQMKAKQSMVFGIQYSWGH